MLSFKLDRKPIDKMLTDVEKDVGKTGHVIVTPWGMGNYEHGSTLTGEIMARHVHGRGVPKRNPIGLDDRDKRYIDEQGKRYISKKIDLKRCLNNIGDHLTRRIIMRMTAGKNVEGGAFKPYSERYAAFRRNPKRPRRISPPDLQYTGIMRESIGYEVTIQ